MKMIKRVLFLFTFSYLSQVYAGQATLLSEPLIINNLTIPYTEFAIYLLADEKINLAFKEGVSIAVVSFNGKQEAFTKGALTAPKKPVTIY